MRHEIKSLTTLRFLAALWVFVFHIDIRWPLPLPGPLKAIVMHGAVGMSLFFILSGYVLAYSHPDGIDNIKNYAKRRFARIYPVYVLAAIVTLPFLVLVQQGRRKIVEFLFIIFSNVFLLQAWFPPLFNYWNDGGSWSISVEAFFYALFPLLIFLLTKASNKQIFTALLIAYAASVLPGLSYVILPNSKPIFYALPIFRLPEFIIGAACAVLAGRGRLQFKKPILVFATAVFAFALFMIFVKPTDIYVTANIVAVPAIALIITTCAQMRMPIFEARIPIILGRASYAFYSMQALLILGMIHLQTGREPWPPVPTLILSFICLTLASLAVYYGFEEPIRKYILKHPRRLKSEPAEFSEPII